MQCPPYLFGALLLVSVAGCSARARVDASEHTREASMFERYPSFEDAVRAQPRLMVSQGRAFLRSGQTSAGSVDNEIKFALSGQVVGTLSDIANTIALIDVDRFQVLDARDGGAKYGMLGSNGIVEIIPVSARKG